MVNTRNLSIAGVISAIFMSIGSVSGTYSLYGDLDKSNEEMERVSNELELMKTQLEDKKHENIVTRINNAKMMLDNCNTPISEKNAMLEKLSSGIKQASLMKDYDLAEKRLDDVKSYLMSCQVWKDYSPENQMIDTNMPQPHNMTR